VRLMEQGQTFAQALDKTTSGADFEAEFTKHLHREYPLLTMLQMLFSLLTLMALLSIFAWVIYRIRRRRIMREWKEEEEAIYGEDEE